MSYKEYTVKVFDDGTKFWFHNGKLQDLLLNILMVAKPLPML